MEQKNIYIIFVNAIRNIGGAQLYYSKKKEWLEGIGWKVFIFHLFPGNVIIDNLRCYTDFTLPMLRVPVTLAGQNTIKQALSIIIEKGDIHLNDNVIIESSTLNLAMWAEIISQRYNWKSIAYLLTENFSNWEKAQKLFIKNKVKQNLLYGISKTSIVTLAESNEPLYQQRALLAVGSFFGNVKEIKNRTIDNIIKGNFNLLSIGRLEKKYIQTLIDAVIIFANRYPQSILNLYLIGGTTNYTIQNNIQEKLSRIKNIHSYYLGYMNPIPKRIFEISDLAIASAGSCMLSFGENVPTISMDGNDGQPIGLFGINTSHSIFREEEPIRPLVDYFEDILIKKKHFCKTVDDSKLRQNLKCLDFSKHLEIINIALLSTNYVSVYNNSSAIESFIRLINVNYKILIVLLMIRKRILKIIHNSNKKRSSISKFKSC